MQIKQRLRINSVVSAIAVSAIFVVLVLTIYRVNRAFETSNIADRILTASFERLMLRTDSHRSGSDRAKVQLIAKHKQIGELLMSALEKVTDSEDKKIVRELLTIHDSIGKYSKTIRENRGAHHLPPLSLEIEDRLLTQLNMKIYESIQLDSRLQESSKSALFSALKQAGWSIAVILLLVSATTFLNSWFMHLTMINRIRRLSNGVAEIDRGNLDFRIDVEGDDELVNLSQAFNTMTAKLHGSYEDLTKQVEERKRVEKELQRSEGLLQLFIEYAPAALAMFDRDMRYLYASRRWLTDYGLNNRTVAGVSHYEVFPEISEQWKAAHRRGLAGEVLQAEADRFERIDGSIQWVRWEIRPWYEAEGIVGGILIFAEEITTRKETEQAILRAKQEWERTFDSVPDLIAIMDHRHRITRVNKAMAQRLGVTEAQCIGQPCYLSVHDTEHPPAFCPHSMTMSDAQTHEIELYEERLGGYFMVTSTPLLDEQGKTIGSIHVARDITERKRAEQALQESEQRLRFHTENSPMAVIEWDRDFIVTRWTGESENIFGWSATETVGKPLADLNMVYEEDIPIVNQTMTKLTDGMTLQVVSTNRNYTKYGKIRMCTWYNSVLIDHDGHMRSVLSKVIDITDLKHAEDELRQTNDKLELRVSERTKALAETVETLLEEVSKRKKMEQNLQSLNSLYEVLCETSQTIVRISNRESLFAEFCRIAVERGGFLLSWVGLTDTDTGQIRIEASSGATGYLEDILISKNDEPAGLGPTGIAVRDGTYVICNDFQNDPCTRPWHKRGKTYGIHSSASIALLEGGKVIGALTLYAGEKDFFDQQHIELFRQMGEDISFALEYLAREELRQKAERALREETIERLRAIEELRKQEYILVQQNRHAAMGEMIGNIAHQWRQPLNTLGLFIQRLGFFYDSPSFNKDFLDTSVAKSMEIIQYMSRTIDDFRNFFSAEKEKSEFNADEAVSKALSLVESGFKEHRISIDREVRENAVIYGFPNQYAQVLLNLFLNARDALHERNVEFPHLKISIDAESGRSVVTVSDNAGGISDEIMGKIFDPYFTTKGPQQGTGIGLFMSKTIIENNMGGRISVRNSEEGAEFRIEV
jgi:PAS domain S-box-containing protein